MRPSSNSNSFLLRKRSKQPDRQGKSLALQMQRPGLMLPMQVSFNSRQASPPNQHQVSPKSARHGADLLE
tara:strand:- start:208 stop:417 length:210 start_codon:yes stop_codon:yes gene_type:complete